MCTAQHLAVSRAHAIKFGSACIVCQHLRNNIIIIIFDADDDDDDDDDDDVQMLFVASVLRSDSK